MDGGTVTDWDQHAADWDERAAVQTYAVSAFRSLTSLAEATDFNLAGCSAFDFGCGTGLLTEHLASVCAHIDAFDTSPAMRDVLSAKIDRHQWRHVRLLDQLPPAPQRYDLIVCSSVLSFVDHYPTMVDRLLRHLAVGGLFVQWDWELDPSDDQSHGFTREEIRRTLAEAGLASVAVGVAFEVTVDGSTMSPLIGSGRRPRPDS